MRKIITVGLFVSVCGPLPVLELTAQTSNVPVMSPIVGQRSGTRRIDQTKQRTDGQWVAELAPNPPDYEQPVSGATPAAAQREIDRRRYYAEAARETMIKAEELRAEGDLPSAISHYKSALEWLPDSPMTSELRAQVVDRYASASVELAEVRIADGKYDQAIVLVEEVLAPSVAPDHKGAKSLLKKLEDPNYFNPSLSPEHVRRVGQVKDALTKAMGLQALGDYDGAQREYYLALNLDPYNTGARRGLEMNEREKTRYFESAYDETRSRYLSQVMEGWATPVPMIELEGVFSGDQREILGIQDGAAVIRAKLKEIIIPGIEFQETPLEDAIEYLRQKSVELDTMEPDPSKRGVSIIIQDSASAPAPAPGAPAEGAAPASAGPSPRITLNLSNVPLVEALRYTTDLAGRKYKVEAYAVKIVPLSHVGDELITKVYRVPPNFLNLGGGGGGGGAAPADDPFAAPAEGDSASDLAPRLTATEVLMDKGITFPPGASAFFNPATSQLVVRNTQTNLELIDTFVDSIGEEVAKQIQIASKFVEVAQDDLYTFGFDWLLGPFNIGTDNIIGAGGTMGSTRVGTTPTGGAAGEFPLVPGFPIGQNPVTSALRTGDYAVTSNSIDSVISNSVSGQAVSAATRPNLAPGVFGLTGVLTDPQFQLVIRALSQKTGADILSAPSVTARSGQQASIEVIREFIYPTEYDPPELPNVVAGGAFPVTPANPTAFETRSTGVTLEVDPVIGADGFTIDLNLAPEVVEFDGFVNYGSPISAGASTTPITANRIVMPVFSTRKVTTAVTVWDGQTVVIGGLISEAVQNVEDSIPVLGGIPVVGRLFTSKTDLRQKRNLTMFVSAKLIDPAGQPIRKFERLEPDVDTVGGTPMEDVNPQLPQ